MLRIHFTEQDLARVQVAPAPDPLWETVFAVQRLVPVGRALPVFASWRRRTLPVLAERGLDGPLRLVRTLVPPVSYFPDFLTPPEAVGGIADGLEALRATSPSRLRGEVVQIPSQRPMPRWTRDLATGDREVLDEVVAAMRLLHDGLLVPHWTEIRSCVDSDRMVRVRAGGDGGAHGLLNSLRPVLRWEPPILSARYPVDQDLHLLGRGLRLVPSYFCWETPVVLADPSLPPVVVYPVSHDPAWARQAPNLVALLGRTRSAVLHAVSDASTGRELSERLGISAPAVSRHTAVLRDAGLITSRRHATVVLHALTPLGAALLDGTRRDQARPT
jgi:DNA-binding transcriptional ArsR family regulator